jgi:hypothetical protein
MLLVVFIPAHIFSAISSFEGSLAMHLILTPLTNICSPIFPGVLALSFDIVVEEIPFVDGAVFVKKGVR